MTGEIVDVAKADNGLLITVEEPGAVLVEEEEEWTQMAFPGSPPVTPRLTKIDLPTRGFFLLHHEGEQDPALFPKGALIKAVGTVRGAKSLIDDQGVSYRPLPYVSASCTHVRDWDNEQGSPKSEVVVCESVRPSVGSDVLAMR